MTWPNVFANLTAPQLQYLDNNFNAAAVAMVIPCTVSGTNALTLTPRTNAPTFPNALYVGYTGSVMFTGVVAVTNTASVTATLSTFGSLIRTIFKDTPAGPVVLSGGEMVAGNQFILAYDAALPLSGGGFHLIGGGGLSLVPQTGSVQNVTAAAGTTLTAANLTGASTGQAIITRSGTGAPFSDTTDTATAILAALAGGVVGSIFRFTVVNTSGQTQTLVAGAGVSVGGAATTATATTHSFIGIVTATGTPAVSIFG